MPRQRPALRIALAYVLFAGLYILFSDAVLEALVPDAARLTSLQTIKGIAFVAATATLLYLAMRREFRLRSRSEAEARRSRRDLDALRDERDRLFDLSMDMLCVAGFDGYFKLISPAVTRILGWSVEEMMGRPWLDFVHPDDRETVGRQTEKLLQGAPMLAWEIRCLCKDGSWRWVSWSSMPVVERESLFAVGRDVTEEKQAREEIKQSLAQKETLLREINHRVKNNMQIILSLFALQADKVGCDQDRELLEQMQLRIRSMAMVHDLLYRSGDLNRIDFADYLTTLARHLHVTFVTDPAAIRLEIDARPLSLGIEQAVPCGFLVNELITNAFRHAFAPGAQGVLRVSLRSREQDGETMAELTVADDGPGLPEDADPEHSSSTGMMLIHSLAGQLRGKVSFAGDHGLTVTVTFPVSQPLARYGLSRA